MSRYSDLSALVNPASIALVGASDRAGSIGAHTLTNLTEYSNFEGELYLVNPARDSVGGRPCHRSVSALPRVPDVVIVAVPANAVMPVLRECADRGVPFAIVFTSGFGETGDEGRLAELEMARIARNSGMRIYGPNVPGLANINRRLGMSFSPAFRLDQRSGPIGLVTQGGGLGRTFMQAMDRGIGVGLFASTGNEVDLGISDFIHYMADAPDIQVIATVIEGVRDGARFAEAALHAARRGKPIVALKIGRSEYGVKAAQSHTASISGSAEVNSAVFRQLGIIEVDEMDELIDMAALLARAQPRTGRGSDGVAVFTYSGGTAALAADAVGFSGLRLAKFSAHTQERLNQLLPKYAAIDNPVDTTAEILTDTEVGYAVLSAVARDPDVGLILFPFPVEYGRITTEVAQGAVRVQQETDTPILTVWMSDRLGEGYSRLIEGGMMPARSLLKSVRAIGRWLDHGRWREGFDSSWLPRLFAGTPATRQPHTEPQAKARLGAAGITVPAGQVVTSADAAVRAAQKVGYPVVAKVVSRDITHKSDVGGVQVRLEDEAAVRTAWDAIHASVHRLAPTAAIDGLLIERMAASGGVEAVIGVHRDPVFGHIITFGLGGVNIELFKDVSRRMLPLTAREARAMVAETRCFRLLDGYRGRPRADIDALCATLMAVSDYVTRHAEAIEELELNPLWIGPQGAGTSALDAVLVTSQEIQA